MLSTPGNAWLLLVGGQIPVKRRSLDVEDAKKAAQPPAVLFNPKGSCNAHIFEIHAPTYPVDQYDILTFRCAVWAPTLSSEWIQLKYISITRALTASSYLDLTPVHDNQASDDSDKVREKSRSRGLSSPATFSEECRLLPVFSSSFLVGTLFIRPCRLLLAVASRSKNGSDGPINLLPTKRRELCKTKEFYRLPNSSNHQSAGFESRTRPRKLRQRRIQLMSFSGTRRSLKLIRSGWKRFRKAFGEKPFDQAADSRRPWYWLGQSDHIIYAI
ncbi:hypothetical protein BDZ97DRAFT_1763730 [Flammula alnicola]|nr:hypothetical protein BDZ97DRAFT_1763730 [Flammula alnicola]